MMTFSNFEEECKYGTPAVGFAPNRCRKSFLVFTIFTPLCEILFNYLMINRFNKMQTFIVKDQQLSEEISYRFTLVRSKYFLFLRSGKGTSVSRCICLLVGPSIGQVKLLTIFRNVKCRT